MRPSTQSNSDVSILRSSPTCSVTPKGAGVKRRTISSRLCISMSSRPCGRSTRRYSSSTLRLPSSSKYPNDVNHERAARTAPRPEGHGGHRGGSRRSCPGLGDVEEQLGGIDADDLHAPRRQALADAAVTARRVEHGLAGAQIQDPDDVVGVAIALLVGQPAGREVEVVLAEGLPEVEPHGSISAR
jgi:hypothetical protein